MRPAFRLQIPMVVVALLLLSFRAFSQPQPDQDLSFQLMRVGPQNVNAYLEPFIEAFGLNIHSGLFHTAKVHDFLGFDVGLKHISVLTTPNKRTFAFVTPDFIDVPVRTGYRRLYKNVDYDPVIIAPTVAGSIQGVPLRINPQSDSYISYVSSHNGNDVILVTPRGYATRNVPLLVPQFTLGLPFGIEAMVRYIPTVAAPEVGDAGKYSYRGFGLRFDVTRLLPFLPVDATLHYALQKLEFKSGREFNILEAGGHSYGIHVSKRIWLFTLLAAYQLENATVTLKPFDGGWKLVDGTIIPFSVSEREYVGKVDSRALVGLCFSYSTLNLFADYNFTPDPVFTVGISFSVP